MKTLEFNYKVFNYVSERAVDVDKFREFLLSNKEVLVNSFQDIYNLAKVFEYAVANLHEFDIKVIGNEKGNFKPVLTSKRDNPAFKLFEMIFNIQGLPEEEINMIKEFYFVKQTIEESETYVFIKDMRLVEGEPIRANLINIFNNIKDTNPEIQNHTGLFRSVSDYAKDGFIICRKAEDVRGNVHFETLLNPKVAIDNNKKEQILLNLNELEPLLKG